MSASSWVGKKKQTEEEPTARMLRPTKDVPWSLSSTQLASLRQALRTTPPWRPLSPSGDGLRKWAGVIYTEYLTTQACLGCGRGSASLMPLRLPPRNMEKTRPLFLPQWAGPSPVERLHFGKNCFDFFFYMCIRSLNFDINHVMLKTYYFLTYTKPAPMGQA